MLNLSRNGNSQGTTHFALHQFGARLSNFQPDQPFELVRAGNVEDNNPSTEVHGEFRVDRPFLLVVARPQVTPFSAPEILLAERCDPSDWSDPTYPIIS